MAVHCFIDFFTRHELLTWWNLYSFPEWHLHFFSIFRLLLEAQRTFCMSELKTPLLCPENESTDSWYKYLDLPLLNPLRWPCKVISSCTLLVGRYNHMLGFLQREALLWSCQISRFPSKRSQTFSLLSDRHINSTRKSPQQIGKRKDPF